MEKTLFTQLTLIKEKYERLGFTSSVVYVDVSSVLRNADKIKELASNISQITNGEKIFNVAGKLSPKLPQAKNDETVLSAFAEYDTGRWLVTGFIEGKYNEIVYNPRSNTMKLPDYYVRWGNIIKPVETKIISPDDIDKNKAVRRIIERINNSAIPQLESFLTQQNFSQAIVFIWTHKPIEFHNIHYSDLKDTFQKEIKSRAFGLLILMVEYRLGLWDFEV